MVGHPEEGGGVVEGDTLQVLLLYPQVTGSRSLRLLVKKQLKRFKGYFADMCAEKILVVLMGWEIDPIKHVLTGSEDPNQRQENFFAACFYASIN